MCNDNCHINLSTNQNYVYTWLLDTGASISAIKYKHVREHNLPIHKGSIVINGVGGKVQAMGYIYLPLRIDDQVLTHVFYVFETLPCKADGIIGQDFLNKYKAVLNFKDKYISFQNNSSIFNIPLIMNNDSSTQNNFNIPARSESIHFLKIDMKEECLVCASEIQEGVFIASSLVAPIDGQIPIQILNTTENNLTLNEIKPRIQKACDYDICILNENKIDANRVKQLFSSLKLNYLNKEEQASIENLCAKYSDVFFLNGDKLTTTPIYKHTIHLKPGTDTVYSKPYRLPYSQKAEKQKQIDEMLKQGIIEPSQSEWSSPVLLVPKKTDVNGEKKWRLVIDYRKLNNCIKDDKFPLPNIVEILDSLSGSIYFSHLDLYQSYYNVELDPNSRKYTAFDSGQYQMTRMPMGLKTSPSSFSRMMSIAMSGLSYEKCLIYLDDLICFGKNLEHHNKNLQAIFERLRKVNLKLNPSKCTFLKKEILYLGHVVSADGILPDPDKITVVKNYPIPKNTDEVKRFVAFVNYYRKFIPNFAEIAYHLNKMCKKNAVFEWDDNCQKSFETLKEKIIGHPILQYPDLSQDNEFLLQTDASNYALGAILSNKDNRPVAFASRGLNKAEKNYPIIEKELLAIVWAVKHFRPYLYGRKFKIFTDHKPLVYLFGMKDPSSRLTKFRLTLEEYDFEVVYVKGTDNAAADALSRICVSSQELKELNEQVMNVMTRAQCRKATQDSRDITIPTDCRSDQPKVVEMCNKPQDSVELRFIDNTYLRELRLRKNIDKESNYLCYDSSKNMIYIKLASRSQPTPSAFVRELSNFCDELNIKEIYFLRNNENKIFVEKLMREIKSMKKWSGPRLCILKDIMRIQDKDDKRVILNDFHLLPTSGHAGIRKMLHNIRKYYFWTGMENDIKNFIKRCDKCQKQKYSNHYVKEPMEITTTANTAFEKVYLDVVGPIDKDCHGYSYILTIQCELTKYVEAFPLITKSSTEIARCFVTNFLLKYGVPISIGTDRGAEFMSATFTEVCKLLKIEKLNSTAYHHQSIGALENTHKGLGNYLRIQTDNRPEAWSTWLPYWCFSYNTSVHFETKFTPFELVFGKKCSLPSNLTNGTVEPLYNVDSYPLELKFRLQTVQSEARKNLINSKLARKEKYDSNKNPIEYKPNDLILVKNETGNKLQNIYLGPYKVIRDMSPNVEILKNGKPEIIHKNRTKLYYLPS